MAADRLASDRQAAERQPEASGANAGVGASIDVGAGASPSRNLFEASGQGSFERLIFIFKIG